MEILGFVIGERRSFATFTPTIVTEEVIEDVDDITMHPVDAGLFISDHIIANPTTVSMDVYFREDALGGVSPEEVYENILEVRDLGIPFDVVTGKRTLNDMLFKSIRYTCNESSEFVLHLNLEFQHVTVVPLTEVKLKPKEQAAKTQNAGKKQAKPTDKEAAKEAAKQNSSGLYDLIFK